MTQTTAKQKIEFVTYVETQVSSSVIMKRAAGQKFVSEI
jgi:hypothetical protein